MYLHLFLTRLNMKINIQYKILAMLYLQLVNRMKRTLLLPTTSPGNCKVHLHKEVYKSYIIEVKKEERIKKGIKYLHSCKLAN